MTESITGIDTVETVIRSYNRCASAYEAHSEVIATVGRRLLKRLELLAVNPAVVLDLGCGAGRLLPDLRSRFNKSSVIGLDASSAMLGQARQQVGRWRNKARLICADAHQLPFEDASVDLIVSNLLLPWCQNHHRVLQEIHRVLHPGGALLFTAAGPDTLIEYRSLWASETDQQRSYGLIDMHDMGDAMLAAGFSAPVLDRENLTVDYPSVLACEEELRALGAINLSLLRQKGLQTPHRHQRVLKGAGSDRFSVTLELVQGHAWKGDLPTQAKTESGSTAISFEAFRRSLRQTRTQGGE